jgi:hypothetical protein
MSTGAVTEVGATLAETMKVETTRTTATASTPRATHGIRREVMV